MHGERTGQVPDRMASGDPQPQIPVLTGGEVGVEADREAQGVAPHHGEGQRHEVLPQELLASVLEGTPKDSRTPVLGVVHHVPRRGRHHPGVLGQKVEDHGADAGEPGVIVVTERHELALGDLETVPRLTTTK